MFLSADASDRYGIATVKFELSGEGLTDETISQAGRYQYGWLGSWNTSSVANGTYRIQSVDISPTGHLGRSTPVEVVVANKAATDRLP